MLNLNEYGHIWSWLLSTTLLCSGDVSFSNDEVEEVVADPLLGFVQSHQRARQEAETRAKDQPGTSQTEINNLLFESVQTLLKQSSKAPEKTGKTGKKRKHQEEEEEADEADLLVDEMVHVKDNCVDVFSWPTRIKLRAPNSDPENWWTPKVDAKEIHPVRGATLVLDHLSGTRSCHPSTARKLHSRASAISLKSLLTKNSGHMGEVSTKYVLSDMSTAAAAITSERNFKDPSTCHEIVEGVLNMASVVYNIRPWSYECWSIIRALHSVR